MFRYYKPCGYAVFRSQRPLYGVVTSRDVVQSHSQLPLRSFAYRLHRHSPRQSPPPVGKAPIYNDQGDMFKAFRRRGSQEAKVRSRESGGKQDHSAHPYISPFAPLVLFPLFVSGNYPCRHSRFSHIFARLISPYSWIPTAHAARDYRNSSSPVLPGSCRCSVFGRYAGTGTGRDRTPTQRFPELHCRRPGECPQPCSNCSQRGIRPTGKSFGDTT